MSRERKGNQKASEMRADGWSTMRFDQCAELIRDTVQPSDVRSFPYIGLEHIAEGQLSLTGYGSAEQVTSVKSRFREGDILFGKLRPYFRKVVIAPFDGVCSTDIWVVRGKQGIDQRYLFYWMASQEFIDESTRASEGTRMPRAQWEFVGRIEKPVPPLPEQRAIAHILGTLDDKIELNRRMSQTLEEMARAIFKSWFVDFDPVRAKAAVRREHPDWTNEQVSRVAIERARGSVPLQPEIAELFPDSFVDSELGEIPEGWEIGCVGDLAEVSSGKRPDTRFAERSDEATVSLWGGNGPMAFVPKPLYNEPILLTGRVGTLGSVFRITEPCWPSDNTLILRANEPSLFEYLFFQLQQVDFASLNRGSTQPLLTQTDLKAQLLVIPTKSIFDIFNRIANSIYCRSDESTAESRTLATLRDALLPKLISGELRVPDAEKIVTRFM